MRRNKYGNIRTGSYASRAESKRANELKLRQLAGEISELTEQPRFEIITKSQYGRALHYTPDFLYMEHGKRVVEEVKGSMKVVSRDFKLRARLFQERYGTEYEYRIISK